MNYENLTMLIDQDIKHNNVPMLIGEPGIGKSSWVEHYADTHGTRCFVLPCNQLADKADMTGARLIETGTVNAQGEKEYAQQFYPHKIITDACAYAEAHTNENPILFLDEINRATPDITSEALSIPTLRSIGGKKIPDNLKVIIAGNDKGNVVSLDTASITRFVLYHIVPDAKTFLTVNKDVNEYVERVLRKNPGYIFCTEVTLTGASTSGNNNDDDDDDAVDFDIEFDEALSQMTTPRTITSVSNWLNEFKYDELMSMLNTQVDANTSLLQEALVAHTGNTPFTSALLEEIMQSSYTSKSGAGAAVVLQEPSKYKPLCNAVSRQDIVDIVTQASDDEKSDLLVYCVCDTTRDNSQIINVLAPSTIKLSPTNIQALMSHISSKDYDKGNMDALIATNSTVSSLVQTVL